MIFKNIAWVILAALLAALPGALYLHGNLDAPIWYTALFSLSFAAGIGILGMVFGVIVLLGARQRAKGGLKIAAITAFVLSLLTSLLVTVGR